MSGPTWLPPRTVGSTESAAVMSHAAPPLYRPLKKSPADPRVQYEPGGAVNGVRYLSDRLYSAGQEPADDPWSPRGPAHQPHGHGVESRVSLDAEIDSLTCLLADMDARPAGSAPQVYDNVPYRGSARYPPPPQSQYRPPAAPPDLSYPQPVPASYSTASTPTGPRFSVQVRTAQPVVYSHAPGHAHRPRHQPQAWYSSPGDTPLHKGNVTGARVAPGPLMKREQEPYQPGKGSVPRPEEELERLTQKLLYDMNHPPTEEYFGRCARCGDSVLGDGSGCIAMEQVFHVDCFTCITCHARLRGQPFYALDRKSYCESCYISTLERCSKCSEPILDRILRAMGKAYHPRCFSCVVCGCCLDGVPFTVDAASQIHCIHDFHRKFAPRCSVCGQPIMPEAGQEETVRIVALDRSFHVGCYACEECGLLLSSEGEGRGCYPLDGHILCKSCSARRIQDLSAKISTDC